jgi:hypothetical protein
VVVLLLGVFVEWVVVVVVVVCARVMRFVVV